MELTIEAINAIAGYDREEETRELKEIYEIEKALEEDRLNGDLT